MLVFIAIIGILALLLMPVLKKAMNTARFYYCLNQQKVLYLGIVSTAESEEDTNWLPYVDETK